VKLFNSKYSISGPNAVIKRTLDLLLATVGILLFGWIFVLAALASRFETGKSGFFIQQRIGLNQIPFNVIKIRTMKDVNLSDSTDSTVTIANDLRVTNFGRFFRSTKIDELPQLINVLLGNMALVGPRPTVQSDYDKMNTYQRKRANVLPGITGWAQINGNTELSWPKRIRLDLEYIERQSIWFDIAIMLKTIRLIFLGQAESHPLKNKGEWN
jgi:lipopolysaccharide/colanic/teichoic acid biosynthesis glycosyltransferase